MKISRYYQDLLERAAQTFWQGYLAAWIVASAGAPDYDKLFTVFNLQLGVVALALSTMKSGIVQRVTKKDSASTLKVVSDAPDS